MEYLWGATVINSIGEIEEIDGLISVSAYASWEDAFYDNMINMDEPDHVETLIIEGDNHMILSTDEEFENPLLNEEYFNKILNFMKKNFGGSGEL